MLTDRYLNGIPEALAWRATFPSRKELLTDETLAKVRALNGIAKGRGQTLAQMAIAWVLRGGRVTSALIGASSVAQLEANVAALEKLDFAADELAEIDRYATDAQINLWSWVVRGVVRRVWRNTVWVAGQCSAKPSYYRSRGGSSSDASSRSRRKRVSSAARVSPEGRFSCSSRSSSSVRRSSSST